MQGATRMTKDPTPPKRGSWLASFPRAAVVLWVGALVLAAFLPPPEGDPEPRRPPSGSCQLSWEDQLEIVKTHTTSDAVAAAIKERCTAKGVNVSADQPAGENWLMRLKDTLKDEVKRPSYRRMRELFIAAEL